MGSGSVRPVVASGKGSFRELIKRSLLATSMRNFAAVTIGTPTISNTEAANAKIQNYNPPSVPGKADLTRAQITQKAPHIFAFVMSLE